jgi:catechol 2,3-dioxygenase-like lactoylglutathione lyase family enzyme
MGLSDRPVAASIAVSDLDRAREFYEQKLGLTGGYQDVDGGYTYPCAGGTEIHIYVSPENAGKSGHTQAFWSVGGDVDATVDELSGRGVSFEQYGEPFSTDAKGIARLGNEAVAWFKDPDGNIMAVGT